MHQNFLEVNIVLCKHIYCWCGNWTFQCQSNSSNHSNQQLLRCNNLQISMNTIQSDSQRCYCRRCSTIILPERIMCMCIIILIVGAILNIARILQRCCCQQCLLFGRAICYRSHIRGSRHPQRQGSRNQNTNSQNSSYGVGSTLMSKNFSGRNVLKHYNKQKQNCQCSYIYQQLQQYEILKAQQYQEPGAMQKLQNQIKNRMHWVFRLIHLKNRAECSCCYQSERDTHY